MGICGRDRVEPGLGAADLIWGDSGDAGSDRLCSIHGQVAHACPGAVTGPRCQSPPVVGNCLQGYRCPLCEGPGAWTQCGRAVHCGVVGDTAMSGYVHGQRHGLTCECHSHRCRALHPEVAGRGCRRADFRPSVPLVVGRWCRGQGHVRAIADVEGAAVGAGDA